MNGTSKCFLKPGLSGAVVQPGHLCPGGGGASDESSMKESPPMPTTAVLTRESPFARRFSAYLAERFPLLGYGVLIAAYYSSNQFLARTLTAPGRPMHYDATTLLGALSLLC